jgi:hypothetical protein
MKTLGGIICCLLSNTRHFATNCLASKVACPVNSNLSGISFWHRVSSEAQLGLLRADIPSMSAKGYGRLFFFRLSHGQGSPVSAKTHDAPLTASRFWAG